MKANQANNFYLGHRKRLRERFIRSGLKGFLDYEILELLLTYSIPRKDTKPIAKRLLENIGSLVEVFSVDIQKIKETDGIGENSAVFIKLIHELIIKYFEASLPKKASLLSINNLLPFLKVFFQREEK